MNNIFESLSAAIQKGDRLAVKSLIEEGLAQNIKANELITNGLVKGMDETGRRWNNGEFFIPQVLIAARSMNIGLEMLEPLLASSNNEPSGTVVLGTVEGDLHDIGKNLVAMMLKGKGFKVIDLKTDVSPERFVEAIKEHNPQVVAMSALLSTTMLNMEKVILAIEEAGLRNRVKIACGGAPVTAEFCQQINADIFEADAVSFANHLATIL